MMIPRTSVNLSDERLRFYTSIFVSSLGLGMYIYFVPIFAQRFGATFLDLGYIGTASAVTYAIAPILVGHLADRVNRWRLFALALLMNCVTTIALVFSRSVGDIILIRSLGGLGFAFFWPSGEILVLENAPREKRVREMGLFSVSWGSAFLIGPLLGGIIIQNFGFFILFVFSSLLIMLAFVQTFFQTKAIDRKRELTLVHSPQRFSVIRRLYPWYIMTICYGLIFNIVATIFPGYASSIGVNLVQIGLIFTLFGIARVTVFATSDHYLHFGEKKALLVVSLLISGCCLLIGIYPSFNAFLFIIALLGGSFGVIFPLTIGLISRHFPDEQNGAAVGSYESAYGIGAAIGPTLAGSVAALSDVRFSFVTASLFAILMMIIAAFGRTYSGSTNREI
jgi:MFS family permease